MKLIGETTITEENQVSLPVQVLHELGWQPGDQWIVEVVGEDMVLLVRRPNDWIGAYSGQMGDVFGDHEDTLRYLDEERRGWERG